MRVQSVSSNNYSKNNCSKYQAFQAHVYSRVKLPLECKKSLCLSKITESGIEYPYNLVEIINSFLIPAIKKGAVDSWTLLCGKQGGDLELLLADKNISGVQDIIKNTPKTAIIEQLKYAKETTEMPLNVNFKDICPFENGHYGNLKMVPIKDLKGNIFIL